MKKAILFLLFMTLVLCNGFAQDILNEGFEGPSMPPSGWTVDVSSDDPSWLGWLRSASTKHSGDHSAFLDWADPGHNSYLITPQLSLSGHKILSFWVADDYSSFAYATTLTVEISTTTNNVDDFTVLQTVTLPTQDLQFVNVIIDLLPYSGQTVYLAFHILDEYGTGVFLDDIHIYDLPSCSAPSGLEVNNIGMNSATISWEGDATVLAYVVERMDMSNPTSPAHTDTVNGSSFVMTGLQPTTNYQVRLKSICADQTSSSWSNVVSFMTSCAAITITDTLPWTEDFEEYPGPNTSPLNSCWAAPVISSSYNTPYCMCDWPAAAHSGGNSLIMRGEYGEVNVVLLPVFTNELNTLRLGFYANTSAGSAANAGSLTVGYMTDENNPNSFVQLFAVTPNDSSFGRAYSVYYGPFDFVAAPANTHRIAIRYTSNSWGMSWNLDDISVSLAPDCSAPTQMSVTAVTSSSATLYWIGQNTPSYQLLYWEDGSTDTTVLSNISYNINGYEISGLSENTTYQWTVRTVCGDGTVYPASYVGSFTTPSNASQLPYLQTFDEGSLADITEFTFSGYGLNQWVLGSATGYPGNSMYISDNNGTSNHYSGNADAFSYAVLDVTFPPGEYEYHLNFDYKVVGEYNYDFFSVYLANGSDVIGSGSLPPGVPLMSGVTDVPNWTQADFTLPNVAGTTKKIIFYWYNDYLVFNQPPVAVDNISIYYFTCPQPSNLSANNITDEGARLSWTENGSATSWLVYYRPSYSTDPYTEVPVFNSTNTTLMDLYSNTQYDCYVVAVCSDGAYSSASPHFTFRTLCGDDGISVLPFVEDFSNFVNVNGSDYVSCWTRLTSNPAHFVYVNRSDFESNCLDFHYTPNCYTMAVLPMFSQDIPVNSVMVSFDARRQSFSGGPLEIGAMTDPTSPSSFVPIDTVTMMYTNTWDHYEVFCDNYYGDGRYLAFRVNNAGNNSVVIDNLVIDNLPTCLPAYNLTVSDLSMTTAMISWTGEGNDYGIYVIGTDTTYYTSRNNSVLLTDLQPSSSYTVYVVTYCGSDTANLSSPLTFFTSCGLITVTEDLPWVETFENYQGPSETAIDFSPCWAKPLTYTAYNGVFPTVYNYAPAAHSGSKVVEFRGNQNMLVLPEFSNDINTLRFSFWANTSSLSDVGTGLMEVGVVTTGASTFIPVDTVNITAYSLMGTDSPTADFMGPFDFNVIDNLQPNMRIAIRYQTDYYDVSCYLDDFTVSLIPECPSPKKNSVVISDISTDSARVSWVDRDASHIQWVVYYKASEDDDNSWTYTASYTTYTTLYNLNPNTLYDVYVVTKCGSFTSEDATRVKHFTTAMLPVNIPYTADFSDLSEWKLNNANCATRWMQGQLNDGTYALFTTADGSTPGYDAYSTSLVVAEKMFTVGLSNEIAIDFDLQVGGESSDNPYYSNDYDYLKLFLAPVSNIYDATDSDNPPAWSGYNYSSYAYDFSGYFDQASCGTNNPYKIALTNGTVHISAVMPNPNANATETSIAKLVFAWRNDLSQGTQPGAIISNLSVLPVICPQPSNLEAINVGSTSADITWTPGQYETEWVIAYKEESETTWTEVTVTLPMYHITGLTPFTNYNVRVMGDCGGGQTSLYTYTSFRTNVCDVEDQCSFSLIMTDSYGDGWNDAYLELKQNDVTLATYTLAGGSGSTEYFTLCNNSNIALVWHGAYYDYECGVTLMGPDGSTLYSTQSVSAESGSNLYSFVSACPTVSPCPSPLGLSTSNVTNTSALVTWLAGSANSWLLQYKESSATNWQPAVAVTNNNYTITDLTPATQYMVQVKALCNDDEESAWSESVEFTTSTQIVVLEPTVETQQASNIASTSAMLNGEITSPGNQTILARGFEWKETNGGTFTPVDATGTVMSYYLINLSANTSYTFRAFATTANTTTYGSDVVFTTLSMPCQTPTNLTQLSVTDNSVTVVWTNHAESDQWQLRYRTGNGDWIVENTTTIYYQISGLTSATTYELQVRSVCDEATSSEWSTSLFVTTSGIENHLQNQITLSPNPAKDYVDIRIDGDVNVTGMEVYDAYGQLVTVLETNHYSSQQTRIDVSGWASGVYFIRVNTEQGLVTKKFVRK